MWKAYCTAMQCDNLSAEQAALKRWLLAKKLRLQAAK
jgi:hypothetical protein